MAFIVSLTLTSLCFSQTTAPKVSLQTNVGEIIIELNPKAAPISTANFLSYVNESNNGLKNLKYTVAMARTRVPDSATSQFFINHKDITRAFYDCTEYKS
jgi:cyclophilin family peptidyl-prolyl cis-trans isomerase